MTQEQLESLISNPVETLDTEYKPWIDPDVPTGLSALVRGCLALRNYGGGCLVVGFRDKADGLRARPLPEYSIRDKFSGDKIYRLIGRYSLSPFETTVHFVLKDGIEFPVIEVAGGIRTPAVTKQSIESDDGETLLKKDAVYTRTLESNNTPSSSIASKDDWERIMRVCMENRETDIGSFVRRHLTAEHIVQLQGLFSVPEEIFGGGPLSLAVLDSNAKRFESVEVRAKLPKHGTFEVAVQFSIPSDKFEEGPSERFLNLLAAVNPNYWNGWPLWFIATTMGSEVRPRPIGDCWEAELILLDEKKWISSSIDFWTASSLGRFYHRRAFWEDRLAPPGVARFPTEPMKFLDAALQLCFVAEALVVAQAFARAMGCQETENLDFSFQWRDIRGRALGSIVQPSRLFIDQRRSTDNEVSGGCFLPRDASISAIFQYVQQATKPLFQRFDGLELPYNWIQQTVDGFLLRRI
jgi:hypothetical protein